MATTEMISPAASLTQGPGKDKGSAKYKWPRSGPELGPQLSTTFSAGGHPCLLPRAFPGVSEIFSFFFCPGYS